VSVRRALRILGTLLVALGVLALAWGVTIWRWQDPLTALVTHLEQRKLADRYEQRVAEFAREQPARPAAPRARPARRPQAAKVQLAAEARRYRLQSREGETLGRLIVPRLGLAVYVVEGTSSDTLKKGPGHDPRTFLPGEGKLIYIAGHRTTYGAPFGDIDKLRVGDPVTLELPYATFRYRVSGHRIVKATQLEVLRSRGREELALQACWPRFFSSQRYIAYAVPVSVTPR
jgi:sortase A